MLPNQSMPSSGILPSKLHLNNKQLQAKSFSRQLSPNVLNNMSNFYLNHMSKNLVYFFSNLRENYKVKGD